MMICSTVSASARRKLPSSAFWIASISAILSSVIGFSSVAGEASKLHPSRQPRWPPHQRGAPAPDSSPVAPARRSPPISTTSSDANSLVCAAEVAHREERRISMGLGIAKFPFVRTLDGFEFDAQPSLDPKQVRDLATCRWVANGDALLLLGPPGVGKTH